MLFVKASLDWTSVRISFPLLKNHVCREVSIPKPRKSNFDEESDLQGFQMETNRRIDRWKPCKSKTLGSLVTDANDRCTTIIRTKVLQGFCVFQQCGKLDLRGFGTDTFQYTWFLNDGDNSSLQMKKVDENINLQQQKIDKMIQNTAARYGRLEFILITSIRYGMPCRIHSIRNVSVTFSVLYCILTGIIHYNQTTQAKAK